MLNVLLVTEISEPDELEAVFLQALYWSIGAGLLVDGRAKLDSYVKYLASATTVQDDDVMAGPGWFIASILFELFPFVFAW